MTIQSEIQRIKDNIADAYDSCDSKGATMPESLTSDNLADCIDSIDTANIQPLLVNPTISQRTITAPAGTDGYNPVTVKAVTSAIDSNIKEGNIKSGVSILGVTGTLTELKGETKTVTPTTSNQTITPSTNHNGFTSVTINKVTSSIDSDIVASNIKSGVNILGVSGTLTELKGQTKTITPTTSKQTITPSANYNGFTSVTVNAVTSAIDSNIKASNIKSGVSILGVGGTYTPDLYIGKRITQNGTYTATNDNKDGYYSVEVAVGSSTTGITYTNNTISTSKALDTELGISSGNGLSSQGIGGTSYVMARYSSQNQSYSYSVSNAMQATENDIPVAKIKVSNQQITGVDMYVSGYDAEYDNSGSMPSNVGVTYDSSNSMLTISANYLNDILGYTFYTADVNLTYNVNGGASFSGTASTTDGQKSLTLNLNAYGNGSTTSYYCLNGREQIASPNSSNEAEFALTYSVSSGIVDTSSITVTIYTSGWEYQGSSSGGNEQGGDEPVQPSGVTVDTTNNIITFSSAYMTDLTSGQVASDVVIAKQGTNYQITQGNCNFQSQVWGGNDGENTAYFRFENNQISFTSNGNENGIFATVTYNYTSASQETNWQSDITITNVTITAPSNWAE